jgi:biopolymer transport protein ExbB
VTGYRQLLADISAGIERLVSRDLDRLAVAGARHASALAAE